ncbi:MAG: acetate/propionate family kinase [Planctomycetota bacterium]
MNILAVNCGSATIKYKCFEAGADGFIERAGSVIEAAEPYAPAIEKLLASLPAQPDRIVHRVVHGGPQFTGPVWIDARVRAAIADLAELAPLHNPPALEGIEACGRLGVPMAAVFDTSFHRTLPLAARTYALPTALAEKHQIQRYGFHGISHQYVSETFGALASPANRERRTAPTVISLHLGNGCSVTAIRAGQSAATSMGFGPLEGLMMGTRAGDLDPGILLHLLRCGQTVEDLERVLQHESGLHGVAGTQDMRTLLSRRDDAAQLAIEMFCLRARQYVGAYLAVLEGACEALIFTGGIGEHAPAIRARICAGFAWAGLTLDPARNEASRGDIASADSRLRAVVIPTNEELQMARQAAALEAPRRSVKAARSLKPGKTGKSAKFVKPVNSPSTRGGNERKPR